MPSLTDLLSAAQRSKPVTVLGLTFDVQSLGLGQIAELLHRFPELGTIMTGDFNPIPFAQSASSAIGALIAAGVGNAGDEEQEQAAAKLPLMVQLDLVEAIVRQTAPGGAGPFLTRLVGLLGVSSPDAPVVTPVAGSTTNS